MIRGINTLHCVQVYRYIQLLTFPSRKISHPNDGIESIFNQTLSPVVFWGHWKTNLGSMGFIIQHKLSNDKCYPIISYSNHFIFFHNLLFSIQYEANNNKLLAFLSLGKNRKKGKTVKWNSKQDHSRSFMLFIQIQNYPIRINILLSIFYTQRNLHTHYYVLVVVVQDKMRVNSTKLNE